MGAQRLGHNLNLSQDKHHWEIDIRTKTGNRELLNPFIFGVKAFRSEGVPVARAIVKERVGLMKRG